MIHYTLPYDSFPNTHQAQVDGNGVLFVKAQCSGGHGDCVFKIVNGVGQVVQEDPTHFYGNGAIYIDPRDGMLYHCAGENSTRTGNVAQVPGWTAVPHGTGSVSDQHIIDVIRGWLDRP